MPSRSNRRTPPDTVVDSALRKVTAIVRTSVLEKVEEALKIVRVPGISVTKVKGFGEYANFFSQDWMVEHAMIEIYLRQESADEIARAIIEAGRTGLPGDGLVIVSPVETVYRIRSGGRATSNELGSLPPPGTQGTAADQARLSPEES